MQSGTVSDVFCLHFVFNAEPLNAHAPARQLLLTMHMQSNHNVRGRRSTPEGLASCFAAVRLPVYSCLYLYSCVGPCLTAARSSAPQAPVLTGSPGSKRAMSEERRVAATTTTGRAAVPQHRNVLRSMFNPAGRLHLSSPPYRSTPVPQ